MRLEGKLALFGSEDGVVVRVVGVEGAAAVVEVERGVGTAGLVASAVGALVEGSEKLTLFFSSAGFSSFLASAPPKENEGAAAGVLAGFSSVFAGSAGFAPNVNPDVVAGAAGVEDVEAGVTGTAGFAPKENPGVAGADVDSAVAVPVVAGVLPKENPVVAGLAALAAGVGVAETVKGLEVKPAGAGAAAGAAGVAKGVCAICPKGVTGTEPPVAEEELAGVEGTTAGVAPKGNPVVAGAAGGAVAGTTLKVGVDCVPNPVAAG